MARGTVVHFNEEKGNGFTESSEANDDVFFHISEITGAESQEGEELAFVIEQGDKGPRATNIEKL